MISSFVSHLSPILLLQVAFLSVDKESSFQIMQYNEQMVSPLRVTYRSLQPTPLRQV